MHFCYTHRYGTCNFAVPLKMFFVNDNDYRCTSDVFGWDFGMVLSIFFCCMCSAVERYFCFYLIFNFLSL